MNGLRRYEEGATAIILVIFSILLLMTISLGFLRLVIRDQDRSLQNELSRGAYDSALAGVEDGKRVLAACDAAGNDPTDTACQAINARECTTTSTAEVVSLQDNEVKLQTNAGGGVEFNQAYTCVTITPDTATYDGSLAIDGSRIIPIDTAGPAVSSVTVRWHKRPASGLGVSTVLPALGSQWPLTKPPIIRAQLIMYSKSGFQTADFDDGNNMATIYLYPASSASAAVTVNDARRDNGISNIEPAQCGGGTINVYACSKQLNFPSGRSTAGYTVYLRLTALYGAADFSVSVPTGSSFAGVQPIIDSTGRAGDVFRRVSARVEKTNQNDTQIYPRATVDITGNFCKNFAVTDSSYIANVSTTPSTCAP